MSLKEWIYFNKKKIVFLLFILFIIILFLIYYYRDDFVRKEEKVVVKENVLIEKKKEKVTDDSLNDLCFFDIKGEVVKPGVYSIKCSSRINDAIILSGGLTKNGDTSILNLSKKIEDGMVIIVHSKKEISNYLETKKNEELKQDFCNSSNIKNDGCIDTDKNLNSGLINLNTASLEELMMLSGIGEAKAKSIINYRNKQPFLKIDDLLNVEGIGESIYVNIKENITV